VPLPPARAGGFYIEKKPLIGINDFFHGVGHE